MPPVTLQDFSTIENHPVAIKKSSPQTAPSRYGCLSAFVDLPSQGNDLWHAFFTQHHVLEVHLCMLCGAYDGWDSDYQLT